MTAAPRLVRPSRTVLLSDTHGPLLLFEDGQVKLGPGWEPDKGAQALLAWMNATLTKEQRA